MATLYATTLPVKKVYGIFQTYPQERWLCHTFAAMALLCHPFGSPRVPRDLNYLRSHETTVTVVSDRTKSARDLYCSKNGVANQ